MIKTELISESQNFQAECRSFTNDKVFMGSVLQAFNDGLDENEVLNLTQVSKHFSVMHGYLNAAYIHGFAMPDEPEWSGCPEASWSRWVEYLRHVEDMPQSAEDFAHRFFCAVDSVHAYT